MPGQRAVARITKVYGRDHASRVVNAAMADYAAAKERVTAEVLKAAASVFDGPVSVVVNAADDEAEGRVFLTVTGTY